MDRIILHSDLNSFYASVECLYNPDIRDKPVAVGGSVESRHGIILTANSIAKKKFGLKVGEAIWQARQKCPNLVVVPPNYGLYLRFSKEVKEIYKDYTNLVESFGIDEAWLDVTESTKLYGTGKSMADEIRKRIKEELGITASIGVSYNKIFAKLGSDYKKPDATTVITRDNYQDIVWNLPVKDLLYVGRSTFKKLSNVGILTIGNLANSPLSFLKKLLGRWGEYLWTFANGYDAAPVVKLDHEGIIKGIGNSMTTPRDLVNNQDAQMMLYVLADSVAERLRKHNFRCNTIQIYVRDNELTSIDRQAKLGYSTFVSGFIAEKAYEIFKNNWTWEKPIRSIGVRATDLVTADGYMQLSLFDDDNKRIKKEQIEGCIDDIRKRYGHYSVQRALLLTDNKLNRNPVEENIIFPVSYFR
ncbi:DNA polymerase IV [Ruminiclostridium cellobioparum]|uniref:DNA polymerase IV n=1 Tax=Ruminiclostridium cellobioparum TaxID=29355 RepID=UPI0028A8BD30|nr:DNA polymerase IV [Ruminiclostridium cellobioparum]